MAAAGSEGEEASGRGGGNFDSRFGGIEATKSYEPTGNSYATKSRALRALV